MFRKSLRTKDKLIALHRARRIVLMLDRVMILQRCMNDKEIKKLSSDDELSFIDEQSEIARQEEIEHSRLIALAIQWEDRYRAIPEWKVHEREEMIEFISPEEHRAMEYVSQNDIDLAGYRNRFVLGFENIPQAEPVAFKCRNSDRLSSLLDKYLAFKKRNGVNERSRTLYKGHIQTFVDIVGDKESSELSFEDVEYFVECLPKLPRNRNKPPFDKYSLEQILTMSFDESKLLAEGSWNSYATNIRSFISHYVDKQFIDPLAFTAIKGEFTKLKSYPYLEFDKNDLRKLFHTKEYMNGRHKKASNYWCPLIALFTGARSNELCQLSLSDIKVKNVKGREINYIDINREDVKSTKTDGSIRPVPIHSELIKLGFLDYVNALRAKGETRVFPETKLERGVYNRALIRWFGETYRPSCGVESYRPDRRKVFHSFRHTLVQHLYDEKEQQLEKIGEVIGHTHRTMTGRYVKGLSLEKRAKIIDSISFDLDLTEIRRWKI